eukprot:CAMPEP_0114690852 /NCGR_PEP_ID=MMETSP0191-20121206/66159_1 /TAXON_ID=126664 /ORGANISM="Sorites sp." /LENGTH=468 /DNA_ID=CAMNT_0001981283 /DNA_START=40 /DNA_END=1448 /DNA_ORIENTATION=+
MLPSSSPSMLARCGTAGQPAVLTSQGSSVGTPALHSESGSSRSSTRHRRIATVLAAAAVQPFCRRRKLQARRGAKKCALRALTLEEGEFAKPFPFSAVVGQEEIKLALLLNLVDPSIGGVMISGERGTGKSTTVRGMVRLLPDIEYVEGDPYNSDPQDVSLMSEEVKERVEAGEKLKTAKKRTPFVELPLGATEDRVTGTIDIERALKEAGKAFEPGILARVNRGILYIDECNLLDDQLVDVLLDSAAGGVNTVEREGVSVRHPARFVLIGTSHPDEGDLRPQLLDRFGLTAASAEGDLRPQLLDRFGLTCSIRTALAAEKRMEVLSRAYEWSQNPEKVEAQWASRYGRGFQKPCDRSSGEVERREDAKELALKISQVCSKLNVDGLRGDIVTNRAARALAALERRSTVDEEDVRRVTVLCLQHRLRKDVVSDTLDNTGLVVKVLLQEFGKGPPPLRPVMRFLEPVAA